MPMNYILGHLDIAFPNWIPIYNLIIRNCQGYNSGMEDRFRRKDESKLQEIKEHYSPEGSGDDPLAIFDVRGHGVPDFKKWFWTSRRVYLQLEPSKLNVFSLGILGPTVVYADIKMTPG